VVLSVGLAVADVVCLRLQQGSDKGEEKPTDSTPEQAPPLPLDQKPDQTTEAVTKADEEPAKEEEPKEDPPVTADAKDDEPMPASSDDKDGAEEKERSVAAESLDDEDDRIQKEGFNCCGITLQA
jgi:hypothetical protein